MKTRSGTFYRVEKTEHELELLEYLEIHRWERINNYIGTDFSDYFEIEHKDRNSCAMTRSKYKCISEKLFAIEDKGNYKSGEYVIINPYTHWACGRGETIMIRDDAPVEFLEAAEHYLESLEWYPVYNEDTYEQMKTECANERWEFEKDDFIDWLKKSLFSNMREVRWKKFKEDNVNIFQNGYCNMIYDNEQDYIWNDAIEYIREDLNI